VGFEIGAREGGGEKDAGLGAVAAEVGGDEEASLPARASEGGGRRRGRCGGGSAGAEASGRWRDAVRVGEGEEEPGGLGVAPPALPSEPALQAPGLGAGRREGSPVHPDAVVGPRGLPPSEEVEPEAEVGGRGLGPCAPEEVALGEEGRQSGGGPAEAEVGPPEDEVGEAGVEAERAHPAAVGGEASGAVQRAEVRQEGAGLAVGGLGRGVEPAEGGGVVRPPGGELQRERGEVGLGDLRRGRRPARAPCSNAVQSR
jgi:hypothetical protein